MSHSSNRPRKSTRKFRHEILEPRAMLAAGALDTTFDGDGIVATDLGNTYERPRAVAIRADGRLVVGGFQATTLGVDENFAIVGYNANGSLDTSFGSAGKVATDFDGKVDSIEALAIQPDGKILAAGKATLKHGNGNGKKAHTDADFGIVRYLANGSLDTSFGSGGKVTLDFGGPDLVGRLTVQADGKILVAGSALTFSPGGQAGKFAVARYNANGTLDTSFGTGGKVVTNVTTSFDDATASDLARSLIVQSDGKIVVAGTTKPSVWGLNSMVALVRYLQNGSLDSTFGTAGQVLTDVDTQEEDALEIALQSDGKIVVSGSITVVRPTNNHDALLIRYDGAGALDPTFGSGGVLIEAYSDGNDQFGGGLHVQPDGRIVASGHRGISNANLFPSDFLIARYLTDGSPDSTFGTGGITATSIHPNPNSDDVATAMAVQADGKFVLVGRTFSNLVSGTSKYDIVVARYEGDSAPLAAGVAAGDGVAMQAALAGMMLQAESERANRAAARDAALSADEPWELSWLLHQERDEYRGGARRR